MIEFTKEEISLCKQVAEKYRKEIGEGDWVVHVNSGRPTLVRDKESIPYLNNEFQLPLWTISDCLEFLREKNYEILLRIILFSDTKLGYYYEARAIGNKKSRFKASSWIYEYGKTPLEACLKAVLEILNAGTT